MFAFWYHQQTTTNSLFHSMYPILWGWVNMIWQITDLERCYKVCIVLYFIWELSNNDCLIIHSYFYFAGVLTQYRLITSCKLSSIHLPGSGLSIWTEVSFILSDTPKKRGVYPAMCLAYSCISSVHAVLVTREIQLFHRLK